MTRRAVATPPGRPTKHKRLSPAQEISRQAESDAGAFKGLLARRRQGFKAEALRRIATEVPDWDSLDAIKVVAGLWISHLVQDATPAQRRARDIYLYVRDAVPAKLTAVTTQSELGAIDPSAADPFGDGTPWPT